MSTATELLRRALDWIEYDPELVEEIRAFLEGETEAEPTGYAQKVIEALYENGDPVSIDAAELLERLTENVEPEADKPVAWMRTTPNGDQIVAFHKTDGFEPLYTRPSPSRKPMTEEEIRELCPFTRQEFVTGFNSGIRWAEKHHNIK